MKSDELMIGDWIAVHNTNLQIAALGTQKAGFMDAKGEIFSHNYDTIKPIPISAEILKKNGFEYSDKHGYFWESDYFSVTLKEISLNYWKIDIEWDDDRISTQMAVGYVHELQHALKIGTTYVNIEL